jgi:hypothetical protein
MNQSFIDLNLYNLEIHSKIATEGEKKNLKLVKNILYTLLKYIKLKQNITIGIRINFK